MRRPAHRLLARAVAARTVCEQQDREANDAPRAAGHAERESLQRWPRGARVS